MIVLAIDTADTGCFAALYDSDRDIVLGAPAPISAAAMPNG